MIARSYLFASSIGLVAGIAAGVLTLSPRESGDAAVSESLRHRFQTSARLQDAPVHLAYPGDDARLARVFSALQQPVGLLRRFEVVEALKAFTAQELPSLMTRVEALPKETQKELLRPLLEQWFDTDLPAARAWALASSIDWTTMMAWAQVDPEGAMKAAAESTQPWATNLAAYAFKSFSGRDLAAQMAHAQSLPQGWLRDRVIVQVLVQRALQDPAGAYASLDQVADRNLRQQTRYNLLQGWAVKEPASALEALSEMIANSKNGALGNAYVTNTAERVAIENPRLVIEWLSAIPPEQRSPLAIAAARQWARKEPVPALEWSLATAWRSRDLVTANRQGNLRF